MLKQRTVISWRNGRDRPIIETVYVDRGPASTRVTRPSGALRVSFLGGEDALLARVAMGAEACR